MARFLSRRGMNYQSAAEVVRDIKELIGFNITKEDEVLHEKLLNWESVYKFMFVGEQTDYEKEIQFTTLDSGLTFIPGYLVITPTPSSSRHQFILIAFDIPPHGLTKTSALQLNNHLLSIPKHLIFALEPFLVEINRLECRCNPLGNLNVELTRRSIMLSPAIFTRQKVLTVMCSCGRRFTLLYAMVVEHILDITPDDTTPDAVLVTISQKIG
ncbi:hypothetical protein ASPWEDRAFT_738115 [Aspergillus wentii DTO 134E9]|uniref:Uncharacterized protein n=1 Tax=Aspergillus wentii DTO 134E9 TaxID=1073089 RepID=A0A1L9RPX1_ASPWE|nr:uncharacterized protein ASPWEDRAFT_738115 [Aspergillus wentii DTO 134E9]OJJ37005.1 hypothetical protein ASPWEDRAFT_738115 [Aspergillus wentii DTO 134E9]